MNNSYLYQSGERAGLRVFALLICFSLTASAQSPVNRRNTSESFIIPATHLRGFENAKNNCGGKLSIHDDLLQFQQNGKTNAQMKIGLIDDVVSGEESKQVGGLPMTMGKAAVPYGGGRVVSLFAHKKYSTLTLRYVDEDGGVHGAIFQLQKGQAEIVKGQLVAQGLSISSRQPQAPRPPDAVKPSLESGTRATRWSVQVDQIDPGSRNLADSFQMAIYENLVDELKKTKRFHQVLREGDHSISEVPNLLVLKTTVERFTPGSETRRAVTTVSGATKLTVRSQLLTREGRVVLERTTDGDVRFFGSNLRATHNLARNLAKTIKESSWPGSAEPTALLSAQAAAKASQHTASLDNSTAQRADEVAIVSGDGNDHSRR